jgi:hypothetical protein
VEIKLDLPDGIFDDSLREEDFAAAVREFAVIELLRAKRLHEHEAQAMLGLQRWELLERMERAGMVPTEKIFGQIKDELSRTIAARERKG